MSAWPRRPRATMDEAVPSHRASKTERERLVYAAVLGFMDCATWAVFHGVISGVMGPARRRGVRTLGITTTNLNANDANTHCGNQAYETVVKTTRYPRGRLAGRKDVGRGTSLR